MRRVFFALVCVLLAQGAFAETIKVGAIASLTGPAGEQGRNWAEGAQLAAQELSDSNRTVQIILEDDQTQPERVAIAFQKLTQIDHVQALIAGTWDYLGEAVYPLAQRAHIALITPSNPFEILSPNAQKNPFIFSNGLSLQSESEVIKQFFTSQKVQTVGIIYPNLPFGQLHAEMIKKLVAELNLKISFDLEFPVEGAYQDSLKLGAIKARDSNPDVIFAVLDYNGIDLITKEFKRLGATSKILTTQHLDRAFEFSNDPERYKNMYAVYPKLSSSKFEESYQKKFGHPPHVYAAQGYDACKFLVELINRKIDLTAAMNDSKFTFNGITGEHFFPPLQRSVSKSAAVIMTTKDGKFAVLN